MDVADMLSLEKSETSSFPPLEVSSFEPSLLEYMEGKDKMDSKSSESSLSDMEDSIIKRTIKKSAKIVSDGSGDELSKHNSEEEEKLTDEKDLADGRSRSKRRILNSIDSSDSDDEENSVRHLKNVDSDNEEPRIEAIERRGTSLEGLLAVDSDKENSSDKYSAEVNTDISSIKNRFDNKDLYDAEGSSDEGSSRREEYYEEKPASPKKKAKKSKKKSKEKGLSEIEQIHSESLRRVRESRVSLPYHQPKQRTLADFLNRRKHAPIVPLKPSTDSLNVVREQLEEREKNVELFYNSDSENEPDVKTENSEKKDVQLKDTEVVKDVNKHEGTPSKQTFEPEVNNSVISNQVCLPCDKINEEASINNEYKEDSLSSDKISSQISHEDSFKLPLLEFKFNNSEAAHESQQRSQDIVNVSTVLESDFDSQNAILPGDIEANQSNEKTCAVKSSETDKTITSTFSLDSLNVPVWLTVPEKPSLKGNPDEVIDLDVTPVPGSVKLMKRFIKHVSLKSKHAANEDGEVSVMMTETNEKGEIVMMSEEKVTLKKSKEPKPGESLVALKSTLQMAIAKSREQSLANKMEEFKLYESEGLEVFDKEDYEEEAELDNNEDISEGSTESEPEENDVDIVDEDKDQNPFVDDEAEESDERDEAEEFDEKDEAEGSDEKDEAEEPDENDELSENGGNYLDDDHFEDLADDSKSDETLKDGVSSKKDKATLKVPAFPFHKGEMVSSFGTVPKDSQLMEMCSGDFSSHPIKLDVLEEGDIDIKLSIPEDSVTQDLFNEGVSCKKVLIDDSDDEEVLTIKATKRKLNLQYSDDEEEVNETKEDTEADSEGVDELDEEDNYNELGSGSEVEDEVEEGKPRTSKFFDVEAELSGSEWGSADEDEANLDEFEMEEGDQEKIDQRKVRKELEKIHMKEVLAEDKREIRILQELLLEDGELHSDGPKRKRLYRWSNAFDDADEQGKFLSGLNDVDGIEEEELEEETWRKMRHEREVYLKELKEKEEVVVDTKILQMCKKGVDKRPLSPTSTTSPIFKNPMKLLTNRGSFLSRSEKMLSKLADMTSGSADGLSKQSNARNMVFAPVSPPKEVPPEPEVAKRKEPDTTTPTPTLKKAKVVKNLTKRPSLFDQLKELY